MDKLKVIVTRKWPDSVESVLTELFDVQLNTKDIQMSKGELQDALQNADALCPTVSDHKIDASILSATNKRCQILGNFGVGFNNIDTDAAKESKIIVTNTPGILTQCTADLAMTLLLMVARRAAEGERHIRDQKWAGWRPTHMVGSHVTGQSLGLIGFGRIAQAVAKKAHFGFDMPIYFYDPFPPAKEIVQSLKAIQCSSLEELIPQVDFLSLHCPGGGENTNLINSDRLSIMKKTAFLINTARGDVVDETALVHALHEHKIAGAGLDVFAKEPIINPQLLTMDNVVMLPHLGSATMRTRVAMGMCVIDNLKAFFAGETPPNRVA